MQNKSSKSLYLRKVLGDTIKNLREERKISANKLTNEYDIGSGILSRIENAVIDCKFITLWRILEGLNINFSDFAIYLEKQLGKDFKLMDE